MVKRTKKQVEKKIKMSGYGRNKNKNTQNQPKKAYNSDESDTEESEIGENDKVGDEIESDVSMSATDDRMTPIFTDHNSKWLKPKKGKKSVEPEENGHYVQLEDVSIKLMITYSNYEKLNVYYLAVILFIKENLLKFFNCWKYFDFKVYE